MAAAGGALALGAMIVRLEGIIALVAPGTAGVLLLIVLNRYLRDPEGTESERNRLLQWTMLAFAAHLLFGMVVTYTPPLLKYLGGDANIYHTYAKWMVDFGIESLGPRGLERGKEGFYYALFGLYKVFGPHPVAGLALNATLAAALVPIVSDLTRRLFGRDAARCVAPLVLLFPSVFLFTSQLLKEAAVLFLVAVAASAGVRLVHGITLAPSLVLAASVSLLMTLRAPIALVAGGGFVIGIAIGKREMVSGLTTGLTTLALAGILITSVGIGYSGLQSAVERADLAESNRQRLGLAYQSGSGFGADVDTGTARKAISYLPVALANFGFGPYPWRVSGLRQLPALVDVVALWLLWPSLWRGLRRGLRQQGRKLAVLLLPAATMACVLSLSVGNFGILVRERMQVLLLLVPFIALGLSLRHRRPATAVQRPADAPARLG